MVVVVVVEVEVASEALTGHRSDLALGCAHPLLRPSRLPSQRVLVVQHRASLTARAGHVRGRRLRVRLRHVPRKRRRRRQCGHRAIISALAGGGLRRRLNAGGRTLQRLSDGTHCVFGVGIIVGIVLPESAGVAVQGSRDGRSLTRRRRPPSRQQSFVQCAAVSERPPGIGTLRARGRRRRARLRLPRRQNWLQHAFAVPILCARRAVVGTAHVRDDGNGAFGGQRRRRRPS